MEKQSSGDKNEVDSEWSSTCEIRQRNCWRGWDSILHIETERKRDLMYKMRGRWPIVFKMASI